MIDYTASGASKRTHKALKESKKEVAKDIKRISGKGYCNARLVEGRFFCEQEILEWLVSLGYKIEYLPNKEEYNISWDKPKQSKVRFLYPWVELAGEQHRAAWIFDPVGFEYVCTHCRKSSEYDTDFCPNCGRKMKGD